MVACLCPLTRAQLDPVYSRLLEKKELASKHMFRTLFTEDLQLFLAAAHLEITSKQKDWYKFLKAIVHSLLRCSIVHSLLSHRILSAQLHACHNACVIYPSPSCM